MGSGQHPVRLPLTFPVLLPIIVGMMISPEHIVRLATAYAEAEDKPLVTVSSRVFGDSKKLAAMAEGADITVRRYVHALQWFSDNWPSQAEWPVGIDRPKPTPPFSAPGAIAENEPAQC